MPRRNSTRLSKKGGDVGLHNNHRIIKTDNTFVSKHSIPLRDMEQEAVAKPHKIYQAQHPEKMEAKKATKESKEASKLGFFNRYANNINILILLPSRTRSASLTSARRASPEYARRTRSASLTSARRASSKYARHTLRKSARNNTRSRKSNTKLLGGSRSINYGLELDVYGTHLSNPNMYSIFNTIKDKELISGIDYRKFLVKDIEDFKYIPPNPDEQDNIRRPNEESLLAMISYSADDIKIHDRDTSLHEEINRKMYFKPDEMMASLLEDKSTSMNPKYKAFRERFRLQYILGIGHYQNVDGQNHYIDRETAGRQTRSLQKKLSDIISNIDLFTFDDEYRPFIELCEHYVRKFPINEKKKPDTLYRGQQITSAQVKLMRPGQRWYIPQIISTTSNLNVAEHFAALSKEKIGDDNSDMKVVRIEIDMSLPQRQRASFVRHMMQSGLQETGSERKFCKKLKWSFYEEDEYLFLRTMFSVMSVDENNDPNEDHDYTIKLSPLYTLPCP